jgi:hypothetical protein
MNTKLAITKMQGNGKLAFIHLTIESQACSRERYEAALLHISHESTPVIQW